MGAIQETKPIIEYIASRYQSGDKLYVYLGAEPAFRYYMLRKGYKFDYIIGSATMDEPESMKKDVDKFKGANRVWFLFVQCGVDNNFLREFKQYIDQNGAIIENYEAQGSYLYLYDMRK